MQGAQFVQLAETLCYDLARAEKATDGKKVGAFVLNPAIKALEQKKMCLGSEVSGIARTAGFFFLR